MMKKETDGNHAPIRLVILLQDLEFGGTQRYAVQLLKCMDRQLFDPELWVLRGGGGMALEAGETGVPVTWLCGSSWVTPWAVLNVLWRLIRYRPEMLYTLTVVPNRWGRIFGRLAGVRTIISGYRSLFPKQHERWLWPLSRRIICNATVLKEHMTQNLGVDPERIAVIPNGVDTTRFYPPAEKRQKDATILFVGRLVREKDPLGLLAAFQGLLAVFPDATLEVIGDGPLKDRMKSDMDSPLMASRVRLFPSTKDLRPYYHRADLLILPSLQEASPNVIIEAMASGLPVVATRVGGVPELVSHGKTGLLVEPGDYPAMAAAMLTLLKDDALRNQMGRRARERAVAHHSVSLVVRQTEKVFLDASTGP